MSNYAAIFLTAIIYGLFETAYFGWNLTPQSPEEMICDGITFLLVAIALTTRHRD